MKKNQKGQSTIEFIFSFMFGMGMVFLFVNVAINYSMGFMVHYATFMASRTFLVVEQKDADSLEANVAKAKMDATTVFERYKLSKFGISSSQLMFNSPTTAQGPEHLYIGAYTVFERPLSLFKFVAGDAKAKMISESFLGKEPTRFECLRRTCYAISGEENCRIELDYTVDDNGC